MEAIFAELGIDTAKDAAGEGAPGEGKKKKKKAKENKAPEEGAAGEEQQANGKAEKQQQQEQQEEEEDEDAAPLDPAGGGLWAAAWPGIRVHACFMQLLYCCPMAQALVGCCSGSCAHAHYAGMTCSQACLDIRVHVTAPRSTGACEGISQALVATAPTHPRIHPHLLTWPCAPCCSQRSRPSWRPRASPVRPRRSPCLLLPSPLQRPRHVPRRAARARTPRTTTRRHSAELTCSVQGPSCLPWACSCEPRVPDAAVADSCTALVRGLRLLGACSAWSLALGRGGCVA